eukprot:Tbor_TRINITY_DN2235_c0_g1::TRINITY_DN2235_c0_g1_i1::g.2794::m.2794
MMNPSTTQPSIRKSSVIQLPVIISSKDIRSKASEMMIGSISKYAVLSTNAAKGLSRSTALTSSAQLHSLGLIGLHVPIKWIMRLCGQGPRTTMFVTFLLEYASRNAHALQILTSMSTTSQVLEIGAKGNVIGALVSAALAELVSIFYFCWGTLTFDLLKYQTVTHAVSCVSSVGGGTIGAAIGCWFLPGIGTAIGSFLGCYVGTVVPPYIRGDGFSHQKNEDPNFPSRKVKAIEMKNDPSTDDDWVEVVDCSSKSYFNFNEDNRLIQEGIAMPIVTDVHKTKVDTHLCGSKCSLDCIRTDVIEGTDSSQEDGFVLVYVDSVCLDRSKNSSKVTSV